MPIFILLVNIHVVYVINMKLNTLAGSIERRVLVNYRVEAEVAQDFLPAPFKPALVNGYAIAGICLIQLSVRPTWAPETLSFRSLNGAHRFSVELPDGSDAVYIPRRDSNSMVNTAVGGRLFPGTHHRAVVTMHEIGNQVSAELASRDGQTRVGVTARKTEKFPTTSVFDSLDHVSSFFENGSVGYSDTPRGDRFDGLELRAQNWSVTPLDVEHVHSTFFDKADVFPAGSVELDNALFMHDIHHSWHTQSPIHQGAPSWTDN